jgi:U4/U6 small nuclear ribonucleoprotein PRP3
MVCCFISLMLFSRFYHLNVLMLYSLIFILVRDAKILDCATYEDISVEKLNMNRITIYVEHPEPYEPPAESAPPLPQPLKLTKMEQKKLKTQRRLAKEKGRQEMIRQGLLEPPKPKVKMSNLMKVLGSVAVQDPTRLELEIRNCCHRM